MEKIELRERPTFIEVSKCNGSSHKLCHVNGNDIIEAINKNEVVEFYMEALHNEHFNLGISFDLLIGYYDIIFHEKRGDYYFVDCSEC
jgi:hypothetical protein